MRADLPGVGRNLQEHFGVDIVAELKGHDSLDRYDKPHWMLWSGLRRALFRSGPAASNVVEGGAFWHSARAGARPDLQFHFLAGAGAGAGVPSVRRGKSGITLNSYTLRPRARGSVTLRSADPRDLPVVDPNFLGDPDDLRVSAEGVKISCEIFAQTALARHIGEIRFPDASGRSQADFEDYARRYGRTSYHPTCTCRMGRDPMAVVDPQLRLHGFDGLRLAGQFGHALAGGLEHQCAHDHERRARDGPDPGETLTRRPPRRGSPGAGTAHAGHLLFLSPGPADP